MLFLLMIWLLIWPLLAPAQAQITLDGSLGSSGALAGPAYVIPAAVGQIRGANMFHSFAAFNVQSGESATFTGPASITNILGRVTGGNPSSIDGLLRSEIAGANLFLFNPAGIWFGPDASLDVSGAFHISTADVVRFEDGATFSAHLDETSVLTAAAPAAFGFFHSTPAGITLQDSTLHVLEGNTLSIVGGDLEVSGACLEAPSGRINLVSVAAAGEVALSDTGPGSPVEVSSFAHLGALDIQDAFIDASGDEDGNGTVVIRGGRLLLTRSGIAARALGDSHGAETGIDLQVRGDVLIREGAELDSGTEGKGDAGAMRLSASTVTLEEHGRIAATTEGAGHGGDIRLDVARLTLSGGAEIDNSSLSDGPGGSLTIRATQAVRITGSDTNLLSSAEGEGDGGEIGITAPTILLEDEGGMATVTSGTGHGGDVRLQAESVTLRDGAGIDSSAEGSEGGDAGGIQITATTVALEDHSRIGATTEGTGGGGDIRLEVDRLVLSGGSEIDSSSLGDEPGGVGGSVTIRATDEVRITDSSTNLLSTAAGEGEGGEIVVSARTILLQDEGGIAVSTEGTGRGGDIALEAEQLSLRGGVIDSGTVSSGDAGEIRIAASTMVMEDEAFISASTEAGGQGGDIMVAAGQVILRDGAFISSDTTGTGPAGQVSVTGDTITMRDKAALTSESTSSGMGGEVALTARQLLSLREAAVIVTEAGSQGDAGSVTLRGATVDLDGAIITAGSLEGSSGTAGDIRVEGDEVTLRGETVLTSDTNGTGPGGRVSVTADTITMRDGAGIFSETDTADGSGGDIILAARAIRLGAGAIVSAESAGTGEAGGIRISATDTILIENSFITTEARQTDGGDIRVTAESMLRLRDSELTATVGGGAGTVGGNVAIDPEFVILQDSQIRAEAFEGQGGNIRITAGVFLADPDSTVSASSQRGIDGEVDIRAPVADLSGITSSLPQDFAPAATLLRQRCAERLRGGRVSSFVLAGRDGVPAEPEGGLPSLLYGADLETADPDATGSHATYSPVPDSEHARADAGSPLRIRGWGDPGLSQIALHPTCAKWQDTPDEKPHLPPGATVPIPDAYEQDDTLPSEDAA